MYDDNISREELINTALDKKQDSISRSQALDALVLRGDFNALKLINELLSDKDQFVRLIAEFLYEDVTGDKL